MLRNTSFFTVLGVSLVLGGFSIFFGLLATILLGIICLMAVMSLSLAIPAVGNVLSDQELMVIVMKFAIGCWSIASVCYFGMFLRGLWKVPSCRPVMELVWNFFRSRLSHAAVVVAIIMMLAGCVCGFWLDYY